jgi:hypothetical protein
VKEALASFGVQTDLARLLPLRNNVLGACQHAIPVHIGSCVAVEAPRALSRYTVAFHSLMISVGRSIRSWKVGLKCEIVTWSTHVLWNLRRYKMAIQEGKFEPPAAIGWPMMLGVGYPGAVYMGYPGTVPGPELEHVRGMGYPGAVRMGYPGAVRMGYPGAMRMSELDKVSGAGYPGAVRMGYPGAVRMGYPGAMRMSELDKVSGAGYPGAVRMGYPGGLKMG